MPKPKFDFTPKLRNDLTALREYITFYTDLQRIDELFGRLAQTSEEVYSYHRLKEKVEDVISDLIIDFNKDINVEPKPKKS